MDFTEKCSNESRVRLHILFLLLIKYLNFIKWKVRYDFS